MSYVPISLDSGPQVVLELMYSLKVRDAMSSPVVTADPEESMRDIQYRMRDRGTTGIPVVEEDMPLAFATTHFNRYKFGRFPVLDKESRLTGIVCASDIIRRLLVAMNREVERLEAQLSGRPAVPAPDSLSEGGRISSRAGTGAYASGPSFRSDPRRAPAPSSSCTTTPAYRPAHRPAYRSRCRHRPYAGPRSPARTLTISSRSDAGPFPWICRKSCWIRPPPGLGAFVAGPRRGAAC